MADPSSRRSPTGTLRRFQGLLVAAYVVFGVEPRLAQPRRRLAIEGV
jgi:hypothetical protein